MRSQVVARIIQIHPLGSINICVKNHGDPAQTKAVDGFADTVVIRAFNAASVAKI